MSLPDHRWSRTCFKPDMKRDIVVGFSRHQGAWALYTGNGDGGSLQIMGGAFDDVVEAKESVDKYFPSIGYAFTGEWVKESMAGPMEDTE